MKKLIILMAFAVLMTSCGSYKRLAYLQDMEQGVEYDVPMQPEAIISSGDQINIAVYCSTSELAAPFNLAVGSSAVSPAASGDGIATGGTQTVGNVYEVDKEGNIEFPIFGKINVAGKTLDWVRDNIEAELIGRKYIKDPVVKVEFTNFKYTLIGEISSGVHYVPDGKMNIFDALAEAGQPLETGRRNDICVVRTVDGKRKMYTIDLTSKDCYSSPVFYLQQNDMIYVQPRKNKQDAIVKQRLDTVSTGASLLTSILNTFLWFRFYITK